jgi:hypothetical protein
MGERYGLLYLITPDLQSQFHIFENIWGIVGFDTNNSDGIDKIGKDKRENDR